MDKDVKRGDPLGTVDVIDCVGKVPVVNKPIGYVNGQPYSGPFHVHPSTGVKMVGAVHVDGYHDTIYDTVQESLNRRRSTQTVATSESTTEIQSAAPTPTRTSAPTPTPTPTPSPTPMPAPSPTPPSNPSPPPSSPGGGSGYGY